MKGAEKVKNSEVSTMLSQLSGKQVKAISLLTSGLAKGEVAKLVGVSAKTISSWIHDCDEFASAYSTAKEQTLRETLSQLDATAGMAISEITDIIKSSKHDHVRLKAAIYVIDKVIGDSDKDSKVGLKNGQPEIIQRIYEKVSGMARG